MSNIFDAVRKGQGLVTDTILASLSDTAPAVPLPESMDTRLSAIESHLSKTLMEEIRLENPGESADPESPTLSVETALNPMRDISEDITVAGAIPNRAGFLQRLRRVPLKITTTCPLLPFDTDNWHASEQYRMVRTKIIQDPRRLQMVLITSACAGDGKSVTAINIAAALSLKADTNVLLVDGDFRRSAIHSKLSLPQTPGVIDVLLEESTLEEAIVSAEQFPNLYILPAGQRRHNVSDLLEGAKWAALQQRLRQHFQFVIVDCPPIRTVSEYDLLQAESDGVVVVGRPDHTQLEDFLSALAIVPTTKMVGVILNCVQEWFLHRPYSSYYDYPSEQSPAPRK